MRGLTFCSQMPERSVSERMTFGRTYKLPSASRKRANTLTRISLRHFSHEMHEARRGKMVLKTLRVHGWHVQTVARVSVLSIAFLRLKAPPQSRATSLNTCLKTPCSQGGLRSGSAYVIRKIGLSSLNSRLILSSYYDLIRSGSRPENRDACLSAKRLTGTNWRVTT